MLLRLFALQVGDVDQGTLLATRAHVLKLAGAIRGGLRFGGMFHALLDQQFSQVEYQSDVEADDARIQQRRPMREVYDFYRQVKPGRKDRKPLGPVFAQPQAIAFREADCGIGESQPRNLGLMMVGGPGDGFDEQPRVVPLRVDVVPQQESIGRRVQIGLAQLQQPAGSRERQGPLESLEKRDAAQGKGRSLRSIHFAASL